LFQTWGVSLYRLDSASFNKLLGECLHRRQKAEEILLQSGVVPDQFCASAPQRVAPFYPSRHTLQCPANASRFAVRGEQVLENERHHSLQALRELRALLLYQ